MKQKLSKLLNTTQIAFTLWKARMFGEYIHTVWNGQFNYAVYNYKGDKWAIPTTCYEEED